MTQSPDNYKRYDLEAKPVIRARDIEYYAPGPLAHGRQYVDDFATKRVRPVHIICATLVILGIIAGWTIKSVVTSHDKAKVGIAKAQAQAVLNGNATYNKGVADGMNVNHGIFVFITLVLIGVLIFGALGSKK